MHFSTAINRPPFERYSTFLQVTSGCSHHSCRFCSFYDHKFEVSPEEEIIEDLEEMSENVRAQNADRVFLQGADPFVLSTSRLLHIADLIHKHLPNIETIGGYARVDNLKNKSVADLRELKDAGYDRFFFGVESGDDYLLSRMNKGYTSAFAREQLTKLGEADFSWYGAFLTGLGGHGYGDKHALLTAELFNDVHPAMVTTSSLTLFPETPLSAEVKAGTFVEATEIERLQEMRSLVEALTINTVFWSAHVSQPVAFFDRIPDEKAKILAGLDDAIAYADENELRTRREQLKSL